VNFLDNINFENFFKLLPSDMLNPLTIIGAVVDIVIISYMIYKLITLIQETRAFSLLKGILLIVLMYFISKLLGLRTISFLIDNIFAFAVLAIVIIFQPEIRKALERLGTGGFKNFYFSNSDEDNVTTINMINEVVKACEDMSSQYVGALIVFERKIKLGDKIESGIKMEAIVTNELLRTIFAINTPLHDKAVIIRNNKIVAASCKLDGSDNPNLSKEIGTRHLAALGVSEDSDAIAVVVSEESGKISYAFNGGLQRNISVETLKKALILNLVKIEKEKVVKKSFMKGRKGVKKDKT